MLNKIDQKKSPMKAIREHCKQCFGFEAHEVKNCTSEKTCQLYPFRHGRNPFAKKRVLSEEQRQSAIDSLAKYREAKVVNEASKL